MKTLVFHRTHFTFYSTIAILLITGSEQEYLGRLYPLIIISFKCCLQIVSIKHKDQRPGL